MQELTHAECPAFGEGAVQTIKHRVVFCGHARLVVWAEILDVCCSQIRRLHPRQLLSLGWYPVAS
jgi:hypothetical protein